MAGGGWTPGPPYTQVNRTPRDPKYGAKADAIILDVHGNPVWNPNPTNDASAIQACIDDNYGSTIIIPQGNYYISALAAAKVMLHVKSSIRIEFMPGAKICFDTPDSTVDVILVEGINSSDQDANHVTLLAPVVTPYGEDPFAVRGRHGIVVHGPRNAVLSPFVESVGGWGVLWESGDPANFIGATFLPTDGSGYVNSNFGTIGGYAGPEALFSNCGTVIDAQLYGGGVFVHGYDVQGMKITNCNAEGGTTGFSDGSLGGLVWRDLYAEQNMIGFTDFDGPGPGGRWEECWSESYGDSVDGLVFTGNLGNEGERVRGFGPGGGPGKPNLGNSSFLHFSDWVPGKEGVVGHFTTLPGAGNDAARVFSRGTPGQPQTIWYELYSDPAIFPPETARMWFTVPALPYPPDPNTPQYHGDPYYGFPFGVTDGDHPRGPYLPGVGRPFLNTRARSSFRQIGVTIPAGGGVIKSSSDWTNSYNLWLGYNTLPGAQRRLQCVVELNVTDDWSAILDTATANAQIATRTAALNALAGVRVEVVTAGAQDAVAGLFLARVANPTGQDVVVDLVWSVEYFQYLLVRGPI